MYIYVLYRLYRFRWETAADDESQSETCVNLFLTRDLFKLSLIYNFLIGNSHFPPVNLNWTRRLLINIARLILRSHGKVLQVQRLVAQNDDGRCCPNRNHLHWLPPTPPTLTTLFTDATDDRFWLKPLLLWCNNNWVWPLPEIDLSSHITIIMYLCIGKLISSATYLVSIGRLAINTMM